MDISKLVKDNPFFGAKKTKIDDILERHDPFTTYTAISYWTPHQASCLLCSLDPDNYDGVKELLKKAHRLPELISCFQNDQSLLPEEREILCSQINDYPRDILIPTRFMMKDVDKLKMQINSWIEDGDLRLNDNNKATPQDYIRLALSRGVEVVAPFKEWYGRNSTLNELEDNTSSQKPNERELTTWLHEIWIKEKCPKGSSFFCALKNYVNIQGSPIIDHWTTSSEGAGIEWRTSNAKGKMKKKSIQNLCSKLQKKTVNTQNQ